MMNKIFILVFLSSLAIYSADRTSVLKTVAEINQLKQQMALESSQWLAEKESLQVELQLMADMLRTTKESSLDLGTKVAELEKKKKAVAELAHSLQLELESWHEALDSQLRTLLSYCDKIPAPLQVLVAQEAQAAKNCLDGTDSGAKLNCVNVLVQAILNVQKNTHRVKQVLEIGSVAQEADVCYLGTAKGFFIIRSKKYAGCLKFVDGAWRVELRNENYEKVSRALAQLDSGAKPELIYLPMDKIE